MSTAPRFRAYIATSLDGFIADRDGGVGWLEPFNTLDYGYEAFLSEIGLIVTGRTTFDQSLGFGEWPYGDLPVRVLTRRPLRGQIPPTVRAMRGHPDAVAQWVRRQNLSKDVWILGGGKVLADFLEAGRVDSLELFVMPVLLGGGTPLFPGLGVTAGVTRLTLRETTAYENGVVRLEYEVARA